MDVPSDFIYVAIGLIVLFISTRILNADTRHIFALMSGAAIIFYLKQQESTENMTFNQEIDYRLELLGVPSHFHLDTNIINLFFSIYAWKEKNEDNFNNAVKYVNNILIIEADSAKHLLRCVDNYEVAKDNAQNALNMIHGFIYSIDHPLLVKKLKKVMIRLQQLLERHLEKIRNNCSKTEDEKPSIDVNSRFIEDADGPQAYDETHTTQFDYY